MQGEFLNLETWARRAQHAFYLNYELPFFNVCTELCVDATLRWCKANDRSFSLACWYACLRAINEIEPFRYRVRGDRVWVHEQIDIGTTILRANETFDFCYFPYSSSFDSFCALANEARATQTMGQMDRRADDDDLIYGSTLPWVHFTSVSHARRVGQGDSVPKVVFGQYVDRDGKWFMPVSVEVHHALMDGIHAAKFFEHLTNTWANPSEYLSEG